MGSLISSKGDSVLWYRSFYSPGYRMKKNPFIPSFSQDFWYDCYIRLFFIYNNFLHQIFLLSNFTNKYDFFQKERNSKTDVGVFLSWPISPQNDVWYCWVEKIPLKIDVWKSKTSYSPVMRERLFIKG